MKIGIVSSVPRTISALRRAIVKNADYCVCWVAMTGSDAVGKCHSDLPDVILVDAKLTDMSGAEATRRLLEVGPSSIVIVADNITQQASAVYAAMGKGAVDAVDAPSVQDDSVLHDAPLIGKLATLARLVKKSQPAGGNAAPDPCSSMRPTLVAIGSSTGGPQALAGILSALPKDLPAIVVIVQHFDFYFVADLVDWLRGQTKLLVRAVEEGTIPVAGTVYLASTSDHLVLRSDLTLGYTPDPRDLPHRPSVDVFYDSIREHWPEPGVAILLTGMGRDGAHGLKGLREEGWHTIAQDEGSSAVYGMPKAAAACGAAIEILPSGRIASSIVRKVMG